MPTRESTVRTYVTLCIYPGTIEPSEISRRLHLRPTHAQRRGDPITKRRIAKLNGWFLSSQGKVRSQSVERHFAWLVRRSEPIGRRRTLTALRRAGVDMNIACFWAPAQIGGGGPALSAALLRSLAKLQIPVWFDVYP